MAIVFTKHAKEMLVFRKIKEGLVNECINNPDQILPTREYKKIYLKDFGKNYLKLIVLEEDEERVIITLYWFAKRRIKEYN